MEQGTELWVLAETKENRTLPVVKELLSKAKEISEKTGNPAVRAVLFGEDLAESKKALADMGAEHILAVSHTAFSRLGVENVTFAMTHLAKKYQPKMILIGATVLGSEAGPAMAVRLSTGLAAHCVDIKADGNGIHCLVPAFGGRIVSEINIPDARPMIASVRPGILETRPLDPVTEPEILDEDAAFMDDFAPKETFVSFEETKQEGVPLEDADVVVCAGRGVSTKRCYENVRGIADDLGAAFGYTRSFSDQGFVPDERGMIGTSGKSVRPKVYLGFGVSGAVHHVCGMNRSRLVISINKDPKAKIFGCSDIGVVGDADRIAAAILRQLETKTAK